MSATINQENKSLIWSYWITLQNTHPERLYEVIDPVISRDVRCFGPDPIDGLEGSTALIKDYWLPLLRSFPNLKRQVHLFCGGRSNGLADGDISKDGRLWVSGTGFFSATFQEDYLGIPASGKRVDIRWGEFYRLDGGKVVDFYFLLDLVDLMQQAGYDVLPPILASNHQFPLPLVNDGILLEAQDEEETERQLQQIHRFVYDSLNNYNQEDVSSMGVAEFFHPDVRWYGPGGIGSCYGLKEFEEFHQKPWLAAFPNRQNQDLDALYAEGRYTAGSGWAGTKAIHSGEYKDVEGTGNHVKFNGMDWWKSDGEKYIENWVFVDMVYLFRQLGVDLFDRLAKQVG
jgi:predicted ester cyclase